MFDEVFKTSLFKTLLEKNKALRKFRMSIPYPKI